MELGWNTGETKAFCTSVHGPLRGRECIFRDLQVPKSEKHWCGDTKLTVPRIGSGWVVGGCIGQGLGSK